ncbi:MAG: TonB-dependent receptor, partial [bacterium]
ILQEADFLKYNCENVGDALALISGVYVNSTGQVMLRDVSSSKVVVIMDGQKLNIPGGIGVNVSNISIENIKSIELLRGGRSTEYGSDAVGGVIVITSKERESESANFQQTASARATYGSHNLQIYSLNYSLTKGRINSMISFRKDLWDGDFEYTNRYDRRVVMVNNAQNSSSAFAKISADLPSGQSLQSSYSLYSSNGGSPGMIDNINPSARLLFDNQTMNLNYRKNELFQGFNLDVSGFFLNFRTRFNDDYSLAKVHSDHKNYAMGTDLKTSGNLTDQMRLSYGYSFRNDRINSTDVGKRNRDTNSAFTTITYGDQLGGLISSWDAALALRYDAPSDFNPELSPRISLSLSNQSQFTTTLTTHFAKSYRAPTFNDLYWPKDAYSVGNPELNPEYGTNYDIGMNINMPLDPHSVSAAVNYFRSDATDMIIWLQTGPNGLWWPENISKSQTTGFEVSTTAAMFNNFFTANVEYTRMEALDKGSDANRYNKLIPYRPKNKLALTGTFKYKSIEWSTTYAYEGRRYIKPANTTWLPPYKLINFNISYGHSLMNYRTSIVFEMTNVTNEDYMRVDGTAEPGRQSKVSLWFYL